MGVRQKSYWMRQADAIKRQYVASVAYAIGLGLSDGIDRFAELELTCTIEESKAARAKAEWDMMFLLRGGKGV